jgi:hypothetical protein
MDVMKIRTVCSLSAAALGIAAFLSPSPLQAAKNYNLNVSMNNGEHCADLRVRSSNGEVAQTADTVTLGARDASMLEIDDNAGRGAVRVRGWDRQEYVVETCKIAVSETRQEAETLLRGISVNRSAGRITTAGPSGDNGNWQVYFLIHAPGNGKVDLQTRNGPIDVAGISGSVKLRAVNGPIALKDCGGQIDAQTTNGPISFSGGSGEVHLNAQNGPISLELAGDVWNGPMLEANTVNGPLSISIPEHFRSGVRVQTSGHAPLSCKIDACTSANTDARSDQRIVRLNGSADTVRVSTSNGPVSVNGPRRKVM